MRLFADRLGPKLNLFLLGFVLVLGAAAVVLLTLGFQRTQDEATTSSREGLEEQAQATLAKEAGQYAAFGQSQLEATAGFAQQAARYFVSVSEASPPPPYDVARLNANPDGVLYDGTPGRRLDVFMPAGTQLTDAVRRDLTDSQVLEPLLPTLLQGFEATTRSSDYDAIAIYFQSVNHVTRMYPTVPDITSLPPTPDLQSGLDAAGPQQNPDRDTYWSTPYQDVAGRGLVMTALVPVYQGDVYRGVIGVDLSLTRLIAQLNDVRPSATGFAFYLDRAGTLLPTRSAEALQAEIDDPRNIGFASLIDDMKAGRQAVGRAEIGGEEVFVAYVPLAGIGGNLGLVAPVSELTAQAAEVERAIDDGGRNTLLFVLAAMAVVLLVGLAAASYLNRRLILRPIEELVAGTRSVAAGDLNASIPVRSGDEIGTLAESFNGMTSVLRERTAALRESEAELSALFRSMTDVVVRVNRQGRYMSIAPTSQPELVGAASQFVGKTLFDAYDAEQAQAMLAPVVRALDTGQPQTIEYPTLYPGGQRWFTASISPLSSDEVVIVSRDITDRKQKEEELREREEQYRSTFESTSDGIVITRLEDGQIVDVNPAFCEMHGYTRNEMMALYPTQFIHPDDHHLFVDYVATVAAGGEYRCRARDFRKDGSLFHVEVLGTPVSYNGQRHILGVVRDITETVQAEQVLERRVEERTTELAALLRVSQAVASTLELRNVGRAILEELAAVAAYTGATLVTVEGDDLVIVDSWGPFQDEVVQGPTARFPRNAIPDVFWEAMQNGAPVFIDDVLDDSLLARSYRRVFRPFLDLPSFRSIRSWIAVPLIRQGQIVGMLTASHDKPAFFTEENARLIVAAANQATVAMENARLFQQTQERTRELSALLDLSRQIATKLSYDELVDTIITQTGALFGTNGVSLILVEDGVATHLGTSNPDIIEMGITPGFKYPLRGWNELWSRVMEGRPVLISDVRGDTPDAELYRQAAGPNLKRSLRNVRTWMGIPLTAQDRVIGVCVIAHENVSAFTQGDLDLATALANQAAVALENARLFEETQERSRELATLLDVSTNVAGTIELEPLLNTILEQARVVAPYYRAAFLVLDGTDLEVLAVRALPGEVDEVYERQVGMRFQARHARLWDRVTHGETLIIEDVRGDSTEAQWYRRAVGDNLDSMFHGIHGWMAIPLMLKDRPIGMLALASDRAGFYTEQHARLARAVADQAAVAIDNARLFEETRERTQELETLLNVSANVASTIELQPLLRLILEQVSAVVPNDRASVVIRDRDAALLRVVAVREQGGTEAAGLGGEGAIFNIGQGNAIWTRLSAGQPVIIDDVRADDALAASYREVVQPQIDPELRHVRSWMAVPLTLKDEILGVIGLTSGAVESFTERDARLTAAIGTQAATAIENARLFEQTEQRRRESAALLEISQSLTSTLELSQLVRVILAQLGTVVDYTGSSVVLVRDDELEILSSRVLDPPNTPETRGMRFPLVRDSVTWQELEQMKTVVIDDIWGDDIYAKEYRSTIGEAALRTPSFMKIRSWMGVPLGIKGRLIGTLSLSRNEPGWFTADHARIAAAVGKQAALAIENARLFEEAAERTREMQTLLQVSTNVAATIELEPLLNLILEQMRSVAPYDGATFFIRHGDKVRAEAYYTKPDESIDLTTIGIELDTRGLKLWELISRGLPIMIDDVSADSEEARAFREAAGPMLQTRFRRIRSWLGVPLMVGERAVGMLALSGHTTGVFNEQHARLARAVADQSALAIENARLFQEASRRARETEALLRADAELFRSLSLDDVFQALCDVAVDLLGVDKCMVTTIEDQDGRYEVRASRNLPADSLARMAEIRRTRPRKELATMHETIVNVDAREAVPEMREVFEAQGVVSTMDVPIRIAGTIRGDFAIAFTERHAPSVAELRLFQALADRASIAIQNAELYEQSQRAASLEERQRLARELHDSVSQALYGIALGARTARTQLDRDPTKATEPIEYVLSLAEAGLAEMRALIFELRPESLQTEGLVAAIEKHVASTRSRYSLDVTADLCPEPTVGIEVKEAMYRVAQEALHNVVKHAHASRVEVRLCGDNGALELEVSDDGRGFDPRGSYPGHVGLHSMRERIEKLRGSIAIESEPGRGSTVRATIPTSPNGR